MLVICMHCCHYCTLCVPAGDVASIDRFGYMRIQDRSKDVIKSGGEWISSIQLENAAMGHPKVGVQPNAIQRMMQGRCT